MIPAPGWSSEAVWKGYVPFDELPRVHNPRSGIIASANQKLGDRSFPYYISTLWEPPSRIRRIQQLLASTERFSAGDFQQFQQDVYSPYARDMVARLLAVEDSATAATDGVADAVAYLRNWDYRFTASDIATTIFNAFYVRLLRNIYEDELGEQAFDDFVFFGAIPNRVTDQLLSSDSSSWFDNVRTPQVETRSDILRLSLRNATDDLHASLGPEMKRWQWGSIHTVTFQHPLGAVRALSRIFNIGPFPMQGGGTTLNKSEFRVAHPFAVSVGASMREVIDLADPTAANFVITSGQVGQPFHRHYDDQTPLWLNGRYHRTTIDWGAITKAPWDHLILSPHHHVE
jgi:penicillin amidase